MRSIVCVFLACFAIAVVVNPGPATAQDCGAYAAGLDSGDAYQVQVSAEEFLACIDALADLQCQSSGSFYAHQDCFVSVATSLIGSYMDKVGFSPTCYELAGGYIQCTAGGGGYGAPNDWCVRLDASTVQRCEGDPPNQQCREPETCPIAMCACFVPQ